MRALVLPMRLCLSFALGWVGAHADLSRPDVRDYIVNAVSAVLTSANITYLKWDFNRHLTEVGSDFYDAGTQGEIYHRFVLGVYDIMERLVTVYALSPASVCLRVFVYVCVLLYVCEHACECVNARMAVLDVSLMDGVGAGVPARALRVVQRRRRPVRSCAPVLHAAGVDQRQYGRHRPHQDAIRHLTRLPSLCQYALFLFQQQQ
jgi:hypothetical protein